MMKKGSLELSVNAIVILILAITLLGLGLGFIKGMFGKVSSQFEEQVTQEPEPQAATGSEPITLSREVIVSNSKSEEVLKVNVYNPTGNAWPSVASVRCVNPLPTTQNANPWNGWKTSVCTSQGGCTFNSGSNSCVASTGTISCPVVLNWGESGTIGDTNKLLICTNAGQGCSYNPTAKTCTALSQTDGVTLDLVCSTIQMEKGAQYDYNLKRIAAGTSATFNVLITIPNANAGTYLCSITVEGYQKDFAIKIKS